MERLDSGFPLRSGRNDEGRGVDRSDEGYSSFLRKWESPDGSAPLDSGPPLRSGRNDEKESSFPRRRESTPSLVIPAKPVPAKAGSGNPCK